jgi:hypothetical protein
MQAATENFPGRIFDVKTVSRSDDAADLTFRQMCRSSVAEQKKAKKQTSD